MGEDIRFSLSVPGKIILIGEHSVLYNKRGLAVTIDQRTTLNFSEQKQADHQLTVNFSDLNNTTIWDFKSVYDFINRDKPLKCDFNEFCISDPQFLDHQEYISLISEFIESKTEKLDGGVKSALIGLFYVVGSMLWCSNVDLCPFTIEVKSSLNIGAGTGSSAAFSVCVSSAIYYYLKLKKLSEEEGKDKYNICNARFKPYFIDTKEGRQLTNEDRHIINKWAYCIERIMHGKPSGLDNTVCTFGSAVIINSNKPGLEQTAGSTGQILISSEPDLQQLNELPTIRILLISTGVERKTSDLVERVSELRTLLPEVVDSVLASLDKAASHFIDLLKKIKKSPEPETSQLYNKLERLVDISQGLLVTLGVSHMRLDEICFITKRRGLHSKLTGAGGGGNAFTIIPPYTEQAVIDSVISDLRASGFPVQLLTLGGPGLTIDSC